MLKSTKDKLAVAMGASLDWYDFALYGFFAVVFSKIFFPPDFSNSHALIYTLGIWFVGFASRPLGGLIFGYIGDIYGRVICFKLTSVLIMIPVCFFPFLPTYEKAGIIAPFLVLVLRVIQGLCIGGEFSGNIVYICEMSPKEKGYFYGSLGSCTGSFGILIASIVSSIVHNTMNQSGIESVGWRIAYGFAIIFAVISFYMRRTIMETNSFMSRPEDCRNPLVEILTVHKKEILIASGLVLLHSTSFYMLFFLLPIYLNKYYDMQTGNVIMSGALLLVFRILLIPFIGLWADRIGGKKILGAATLIFLVTAYPCFCLISRNNIIIVNICMIFMAILTSMNAAAVPGLLMEILPVKTRYASFAIVFNVCFAILGGIVPSFSIFLVDYYENKLLPGVYLTLCSVLTLMVLQVFIKEDCHGKCYIYADNKL
jgi:MHS family proline/betaine transporter-like MFS transporter